MSKNFGFAVIVLALLTGCDSGMTYAPVTGTVTVDGKPLAYKTVVFFPDAETPGSGGGANTDKDGKYTMLATAAGATTSQQGLPPGRYSVMVVEPLVPIAEATEVQSADSTELTPAVGPPMRSRSRDIPPIYTTRETTPLAFDITDEGGVFDLKLVTK